ncbi:MAG: acyltransferase domain-containing protein [Pseudomonadota bacterium]
MGKDLFPAYPDHVATASQLLGYSVADLCLQDDGGRLRLTQFTQPALYVVNALEYLRMADASGGTLRPDWFAGHSLGEFNALLAAGAFDFATGLRLVQKRGELMAAANGGAMAAVLGPRTEELEELLQRWELQGIDIANLNTPTQHVIAGSAEAIAQAAQRFAGQPGLRFAPLNVSAAFHSRHMQAAQQEFAAFMRGIAFAPPAVPVVANATARPYEPDAIAETLALQIASPVRWTDSIRWLLGQGVEEFTEAGNNGRNFGGDVLTKMVDAIKKSEAPLFA